MPWSTFIFSEAFTSDDLIIQENSYGKCVVANRTFQPGEIVTLIQGEAKSFKEHTFVERPYLFYVGREYWLNPVSYARYINHSCDPNCRVIHRLDIVAVKPIAIGEEITWCYNEVKYTSGIAELREENRWDHAFTFICLCGSINCQKLIINNFLKSP